MTREENMDWLRVYLKNVENHLAADNLRAAAFYLEQIGGRAYDLATDLKASFKQPDNG